MMIKSYRILVFPALWHGLTLLLLSLLPTYFAVIPAYASSRSEQMAFQRTIIDSRNRLHPKYKRVRRKATRYIIVHTSEAGLKSTLNVITGGKHIRGRRITYGGHANYVIARNGKTYRIMDKAFKADHAGLSMWEGRTNLSRISIGIELAGYHYMEITPKQYHSLALLIDILQKIYNLNDRAVLTHSQIAYGNTNRWIKGKHRGRKRCAKNFIRSKAGLGPTWAFDPDVKAGRLKPDRKLAAIFYAPRPLLASRRLDSNIITRSNTAWSIAGEDYDAANTLYRLPGGKLISGDRISDQIGWSHLPKKTEVLLNQTPKLQLSPGRLAIKTISNGLTAWTIAGPAYRHNSTFYFFPKGYYKSGPDISDWDDLPTKTKIIMGYAKPIRLKRGFTPLSVAGKRYKSADTLYYLPNKSLLSGKDIKNFKHIPTGALIFLPQKKARRA